LFVGIGTSRLVYAEGFQCGRLTANQRFDIDYRSLLILFVDEQYALSTVRGNNRYEFNAIVRIAPNRYLSPQVIATQEINISSFYSP
jgi:hypothetical protein